MWPPADTRSQKSQELSQEEFKQTIANTTRFYCCWLITPLPVVGWMVVVGGGNGKGEN